MTLAPPAPTLILGVDPGFTGALALYDFKNQDLYDVIDMPVKPIPKKLNRGATTLDLEQLSLYIDKYAKAIAFAVIEEVSSAPEQGVASTFRFGYAAGAVAGAISAFYIPIAFIRPSVWKIAMGLSRDKKESIERARKLFGNTHASAFTLMKHDGRAEAALLAYFGLRLRG